LLEKVFSKKSKSLVDIGGNTGKWAMQCCNHDSDVEVTIVDLSQQLEMVMANAKQHGHQKRVTPFPPTGVDVWCMSLFLDCFSPMEILSILKRVRSHMSEEATAYILELFWDAQKYDAASYSLNATSLYFACLANGNSRFYCREGFLEIVEEAGFEVVTRTDDIGLGHTLLELKVSAQ
jgi:ubiquinone/menaquinone biosynthesis C-methylase UbiE